MASLWDKNSKFFHITTVQRRDRNRIDRIKNLEGEWVEGNKDIMKAIEDYYKSLYTASSASRVDACQSIIPRLVSEEVNEALLAPITLCDVKQVVFSLGA